jgi:hypothetical protein
MKLGSENQNMKRALTSFAVAFALFAGWTSAAFAQDPVTPESLVPCPFTAEELQAALGVPVERGEASDMSYPGGRDVGCYYAVQNSMVVISVRQTWDPSGNKSAPAAPPEHGGGLVEPIPDDPDGARWEHGPKDKPDIALKYGRKHVQTTLLAYGGTFRNEDMKPKLARLKRVP